MKENCGKSWKNWKRRGAGCGGEVFFAICTHQNCPGDDDGAVHVRIDHFPAYFNCGGDYIYSVYRRDGYYDLGDHLPTERDCPTNPSLIKADVERILDDQGSFPPCAITH